MACAAAADERVHRRADHLLGPGPHLEQGLRDRLVALEPGGQPHELRDRHALVGGALQVQVDVHDSEQAAQVSGDRRLLGEQVGG